MHRYLNSSHRSLQNWDASHGVDCRLVACVTSSLLFACLVSSSSSSPGRAAHSNHRVAYDYGHKVMEENLDGRYFDVIYASMIKACRTEAVRIIATHVSFKFCSSPLLMLSPPTNLLVCRRSRLAKSWFTNCCIQG